MAKVWEINQEVLDAWLAERPQIKSLVDKYPPNLLYRMKDTGQIVTIYSYSEDNTVRVTIEPGYRMQIVPYGVFGVDPQVLEEYEPEKGEPIEVYIDGQRIA